MSGAPPALARTGHHRSEAAPIELFFDLVYVFAIIQLSHLLIEHLTWEGAAQTVVVFAAVWWGWNYTAWAMNWLDPSRTSVQLLNGVLMLAALGMSVAIPTAFGDGEGVFGAPLFVACYLFMGIVRPVFMMVAYRGHRLAANYRMLLIWTLGAGVFWVAGCLVPAQWRLLLWLVAVAVDYAAPLAQYRVPGVGAAPMDQWDPDAGHLAERNRLVFIIALGESILLMGGTVVTQGALAGATALIVVIGFASLFALWWNYFALAGPDVTVGRGSTSALRSAYAYAHALMVLGAIVVAVSIELRLSHEHLTPAAVLVTVVGPIIYLVGNLLYIRSRFGRRAPSRIVAAGALAVAGAVALAAGEHLPGAVLSGAVLIVLVVLAVQTVRERAAAA